MQLFAPLKDPISKPFAAVVESPMGRLSSCLIRANLDGNDGPPVFYVLLVISRNLGGRDATTLPGKYTIKTTTTWNLVGSDAPSLLDKSDNEKLPQVASMPPPDKKRKRLLEEDLLESKRSRDGGRGARSPIARLDNHY